MMQGSTFLPEERLSALPASHSSEEDLGRGCRGRLCLQPAGRAARVHGCLWLALGLRSALVTYYVQGLFGESCKGLTTRHRRLTKFYLGLLELEFSKSASGPKDCYLRRQTLPVPCHNTLELEGCVLEARVARA